LTALLGEPTWQELTENAANITPLPGNDSPAGHSRDHTSIMIPIVAVPNVIVALVVVTLLPTHTQLDSSTPQKT
jgi:hypothetical protein